MTFAGSVPKPSAQCWFVLQCAATVRVTVLTPAFGMGICAVRCIAVARERRGCFGLGLAFASGRLVHRTSHRKAAVMSRRIAPKHPLRSRAANPPRFRPHRNLISSRLDSVGNFKTPPLRFARAFCYNSPVRLRGGKTAAMPGVRFPAQCQGVGCHVYVGRDTCEA